MSFELGFLDEALKEWRNLDNTHGRAIHEEAG
jgi:mRNA-degrading endonuclease RelE of RelBE toxin-antitoxin system